jgi:nucleotide-binding universal stress UspA family protein
MARINRILVPIDFSENSVVAARQASELARRFHSAVTLFHADEYLVVPPLAGTLGIGMATGEVERSLHVERQQEQLDHFAAEEFSGIPTNRKVCWGDAAKLIVERAKAEPSDLIVMPTRGRGVLRRLLLGSVTAKVLHDADCPVWTGAHLADAPATPLADLRHVMCGVNFGAESLAAIQWAADIACAFGADLTVVHVAIDPPASLPVRYVFQWREQVNWAANEQLQSLLLESKTLAEVLVVNDGDIAKSLAATAHERGAGLLVIGRGRTGGGEKKLGVHTYATICRAPCPVVSV